jgi:hypothetical protein
MLIIWFENGTREDGKFYHNDNPRSREREKSKPRKKKMRVQKRPG